MLFHDINGAGIPGNEIDPLAPFLEFLAIEKDTLGLLGREGQAELVQAVEKLFLITHGLTTGRTCLQD